VRGLGLASCKISKMEALGCLTSMGNIGKGRTSPILERRFFLIKPICSAPFPVYLEVSSSNMKGENLNEICPTIRGRKAIDFFIRTRLPKVNVKTADGSVDLSGTVRSLEAREHAVKLASRVAGVQAVVNHLEVKK